MRRLTLTALAIASLSVSWASADGCALTLAMNIEEMVERAGTIALGECVSVEERWAPIGGANLPVTLYTFAVDEAIRGEATSGRIAFRQYGHPIASLTGRGSIGNMPQFVPGERHLLLLAEPSPVTGLTAPVGLEQGAFLETERDGQRVLVNGRQNAGLFDDLPESTQRAMRSASSEPAEALLDLVRRLAAP